MGINKAKPYFDMMAQHKLLDRIQSIQIGDEDMDSPEGKRKGGSVNISFYPKDMQNLTKNGKVGIGFHSQKDEQKEEIEND